MKTLILSFLISMICISANALTLEECKAKSDAEIAKIFLATIGYGAQNGKGNKSCKKKAAVLDVMVSNLEYEDIKNTIVADDAKLEIINTLIDPEDDGMITAIYQVTNPSKKPIKGTFKFYRTKSLLDPKSINEVKCGMLAVDPSRHFMLKSCE